MTLVGALSVAVAPFLSGGAGRPDAVDGPVVGLAAGLVAVAALGFTPSKGARITAVAGALIALGVTVRLLVVDLGVGLTGPRLPVLAVGALAVTAGVGAAAGSWRVRPVGLIAAVIALVATVGAPWAAQAVIVESHTHDVRGLEPPAVAERPTGRQWSWQPSADVVDVVAAGHGVVVATNDGGVVALDGLDGREQWRYTRRGAWIGMLIASLDRRAVVVTFRSALDTRAQLLVALDAGTGSVRFEKVIRSVLAEADDVVPGTRTLALRDGESIAGYDLVTGDERWRWSPPEGCQSPYARAVRGPSTVFVPVECSTTLSLAALDEVTGQERWRHEVGLGPPDGEGQDIYLDGTTDGAVVSLRIITARALPGSVTSGLFDAETGRQLAHPGTPWTVRARVGPRPLLEEQDTAATRAIRSIDLATGTMTALDVAACPQRTADATTTTTYLRVCGDNGRELTLVVQGLDGTPPTTTQVRLDGSGSLPELKLVPAPGAIVLARGTYGGTPAPVVGLGEHQGT
ncbi:PQQ-binding-like beta-propeller repeat protein [Actinosynnema sp. CS-041913]|uniref:outer membrane protein assembly factor BamB family protein n=1 Tax=Actinosynnema sp. CS-041913 TaxID=3239917 RepID=UPI003D908662